MCSLKAAAEGTDVIKAGSRVLVIKKYVNSKYTGQCRK